MANCCGDVELNADLICALMNLLDVQPTSDLGDVNFVGINTNSVCRLFNICDAVGPCVHIVLPDGTPIAGTGTAGDPYVLPLTSISRTGPLEITYVDENGDSTVIDLCPDVPDCETLTALDFDPVLNTLTYTDENGTPHVIDLTALAVDINVASVTFNPLTGALTLTETDGSIHTVNLGVFTETPLVITTDGTTTGVTQSGTSDHIADITLLSADANNVLVSGTGGGLHLPLTVNDGAYGVSRPWASTDTLLTEDQVTDGATFADDLCNLETNGELVYKSAIDGLLRTGPDRHIVRQSFSQGTGTFTNYATADIHAIGLGGSDDQFGAVFNVTNPHCYTVQVWASIAVHQLISAVRNAPGSSAITSDHAISFNGGAFLLSMHDQLNFNPGIASPPERHIQHDQFSSGRWLLYGTIPGNGVGTLQVRQRVSVAGTVLPSIASMTGVFYTMTVDLIPI